MAKEYEQLVISDDFMYGKVTEDLLLTKEMLEVATERTIEEISYAENQKIIRGTVEGKDVRFDSYVEDQDKVSYDSEMHNRGTEDTKANPQLPKRSRYYQGMIDVSNLQSGSSYRDLRRSYIIFFCTFDPFGQGLSKYTFENMCREQSNLPLNDECVKIFFNTKGKNREQLTEKQDNLLRYVESGEIRDDFTRRLDNKVKEVRQNKNWRREYMKTITHDQDIRDEERAKVAAEIEELRAKAEEERAKAEEERAKSTAIIEAQQDELKAKQDEIASLKAQLSAMKQNENNKE